MKIYLVRWPHFQVSLIAAKDETDLLWKIDEVGDPSNCKYKVYSGELHLSFGLNLDFKDDTNYELAPIKPKVVFEGTEQFLQDGPKFQFLDSETCDSHDEMWDSILKYCFPELWKLNERRFAETYGLPPSTKSKDLDKKAGPVTIENVKAAAMKELAAFFKGGEQWKDLNDSVKRREEHGDN